MTDYDISPAGELRMLIAGLIAAFIGVGLLIFWNPVRDGGIGPVSQMQKETAGLVVSEDWIKLSETSEGDGVIRRTYLASGDIDRQLTDDLEVAKTRSVDNPKIGHLKAYFGDFDVIVGAAEPADDDACSAVTKAGAFCDEHDDPLVVPVEIRR